MGSQATPGAIAPRGGRQKTTIGAENEKKTHQERYTGTGKVVRTLKYLPKYLYG
jgi:hypothetical protein